jgi:hypothetical protein
MRDLTDDQIVKLIVASSLRSFSLPYTLPPETPHWVISPSTQAVPSRSIQPRILLESVATGQGDSRVGGPASIVGAALVDAALVDAALVDEALVDELGALVTVVSHRVLSALT